MSLHLVPITFEEACGFVEMWHRHHQPKEGESGASLRAAGWRVIAERPARKGWSTPSRPREDRGTDGIPRTLWEAS